MAKLQTQKSNKEYKCSKCGEVINKGDIYHKIVERFSTPKIRCNGCKPKRWELTGSDYFQWLWEFQDNVRENYIISDETIKDDIYSEIETKKEELEERLENMPEGLRDSSTAGETLQERIDALDEALSELDNYDYPEIDDIRGEVETEEDEDSDLTAEQIEEKVQERFSEAIDEYSENIYSVVENLS